MILDHVPSSDYVVSTPDFDVFVEQMDGLNPDLEGFRVAPPGGGLPVGVPGSRELVYDFDALGEGDVKAYVAEGKELGAMERSVRGLRSGQAAVTPIPPAPCLGPAAHPVPLAFGAEAGPAHQVGGGHQSWASGARVASCPSGAEVRSSRQHSGPMWPQSCAERQRS